MLLADGNVGIGGDPAALLARCRDLIGATGRVLVELDPPGTGLRADRVRLEHGAQRGSWFDWAHVGVDAVAEPAAQAGLRVAETWERAGRSFAALVPTPCSAWSGVLSVRILVTGGAGFIGSHVVGAYRDAGHDVRVLDALLPAVHPAGVVPDLPDGVELLVGDVRDAATVDRALDGVDAVCHQAAMVGLGVDVQDLPEYVVDQRVRHRGPAGRHGPGRHRPAGAGELDGGLRRGPLRVPRGRRRPGRAAAAGGPGRRPLRAAVPACAAGSCPGAR